MPEAIKIIRLEHHYFSSVLACFRYVVEQVESGELQPNFDFLSAVLDYIEGFPDSFHHPKEDEFLFPALRRRSAEAAALIDRLSDEHVQGVELLGRLRGALAACRRDAAAFGPFAAAAKAYIDFEIAHIGLEERELLPLAERALEAADWAAIDAAFGENDDPLFGTVRRDQFEGLYRQILELTPDPPSRAPAVTRRRPAS